MWDEEARAVAQRFEALRLGGSSKPVVLYGLGKNTRAILELCSSCEIAGLMDAAAVGQTVYGKKVLSDDEVIGLKPVIVIIARNSIVNIIYKRIEFLEQYGIEILNLSGRRPGEGKNTYANEALPYWEMSRSRAEREIDSHRVISFDIFDTLLARRVPKPEDMFELVGCAWRGTAAEEFAEKRAQAGKQAGCTAGIDEIYRRLGELSGIPGEELARLQELEYELERAYLRPRPAVRDLLFRARRQKKKVCLVSDMYDSRPRLEELLASCGVERTAYDELFVSCDWKKDKESGDLYEIVKSWAGDGDILHIGDNRIADGKMAVQRGLSALQVYSGYELLMASRLQMLLAEPGGPARKRMLGLFIEKAFSDPFALYGRKGVLFVDSLKELGYLFMAPLLLGFSLWLLEAAGRDGKSCILFPSRDGYLIKQICERVCARRGAQAPEFVYFKTSRRCVAVASIRTEEDIRERLDRPYRGTVPELLRDRFGVEIHTGGGVFR